MQTLPQAASVLLSGLEVAFTYTFIWYTGKRFVQLASMTADTTGIAGLNGMVLLTV